MTRSTRSRVVCVATWLAVASCGINEPGESASVASALEVTANQAPESNPSIPEGKVLTPRGMMDQACVHEVPNGAEIDLDGNVYVDGRFVKKVAKCGPKKGAAATVALPALGSDGYIEESELHLTPGDPTFSFFNKLTARWVVPAMPPYPIGDFLLQYYFPALQDDVNAILQPVLQLGPQAGIGSSRDWVLAAWIVLGGGSTAIHSTAITVHEGEVLEGIIEIIHSPYPGVYQYKVTATDVTTGQSRYIMPAVPYKMMTAMGGALEAYRTGPFLECAYFPSDGGVRFYNIKLSVAAGTRWWEQNQVAFSWNDRVFPWDRNCNFRISSVGGQGGAGSGGRVTLLWN